MNTRLHGELISHLPHSYPRASDAAPSWRSFWPPRHGVRVWGCWLASRCWRTRPCTMAATECPSMAACTRSARCGSLGRPTSSPATPWCGRIGWKPTINWPPWENGMNLESLRERATALRLNGLLAHWPDVATADWLAPPLQWSEGARVGPFAIGRSHAGHSARFRRIHSAGNKHTHLHPFRHQTARRAANGASITALHAANNLRMRRLRPIISA